jgi:hypothetical protein
MTERKKLFLILLAAGFSGVLSILLIDLAGLVAILPAQAGTKVPQITPALKILSLIQPTFILAIAVLAGVVLAPRVGLAAPSAQAASTGGNLYSALKPQILPGVVGGVTGGLAVVFIGLAWKPFLPSPVTELISDFTKSVPLPTRLLYGGVTEELLLRWGLMTFLAWAGWRLFEKGRGAVKAKYFVLAILLSSFVFAVGHLPIAFLLFPEPSVALITFVLVANSAFGLIAGFLYWKKGLESAVIAHILAHVVMFTASYFKMYF